MGHASVDVNSRPVNAGDLLWTPSAERIANSNLTAFLGWLEQTRDLRFDDYEALWTWSVTDLEGFWSALWDYFRIEASTPYRRVLSKRDMPGAVWFEGAKLNFAHYVMRNESRGGAALLFQSETEALRPVQWAEFGAAVRRVATALREMGVKPGDRVAGYMPNAPEAFVALLATTAIGAIWSVCSPDFGVKGVLDRLSQLDPKVIFCVDGYTYGGKPFDRRAQARQIVERLPSLTHVIEIPYLDRQAGGFTRGPAIAWAELMARDPVAPENFRFEQVEFGHPLWILFSSGTTGLPKPIMHGHGGIVIEMLKSLVLQMNFKAGDRAFFYTTTGWMMFNFLVTMLMVGACPLVYDGNPAYPHIDTLWKLAEESRAVFFGASPSYVEIMRKAAIVPGEKFDLSALRVIMPAGSPVSAETTAWFYRNVKKDLWIATGSGGTDCCTGLVGPVPNLPVRAGEIQARQLGIAVECFDEAGRPQRNQVGELVITQPMPSMPIGFWGDENHERYRATYFDYYPGVWRHGDLLKINDRGGCFVLGRSDATLNRHGVRIGTADIYRTLEAIPELDDSLIVNLDLPAGGFFMPLFVKLKGSAVLDDALIKRIAAMLRQEYSPRHVPDRIIAVPDIPYTRTGKKVEVPIRRILLGADPAKVANPNTIANPEALTAFMTYFRDQNDYSLDSVSA
jgi:acetoacetyl-CoA synthetase